MKNKQANKQTKHIERNFFWGFSLYKNFGYFLLFAGIKTKLIKFNPKFQIKQAKFLPCNFSSFLLRNKSVQWNDMHIFRNFKVTVWVLRVNETKLLLEKAFIVDIFSLGSEKETTYLALHAESYLFP